MFTQGDVNTKLHSGATIGHAENVAEGDAKYALNTRNVSLRKGDGNSARYYNNSVYVSIDIDQKKVDSGRDAIIDYGIKGKLHAIVLFNLPFFHHSIRYTIQSFR